MKNNKTTIWALLLFALFNLSSCEMLFRPEEFLLSKIDNEQELEEAIIGIRDNLHSKAYYLFYSAKHFGDDVFVPKPNGPGPYVNYYTTGNACYKGAESFDIYEGYWIYWYTIIASTNNILSQFQFDKVKEAGVQQLLGEALFYRAFCYYGLTRIYGRVPLVSDTDIDFTKSRATPAEIYGFIENDLKQAMKLLPTTKAESRIPNETPCKGTAKALLGEVYLSWAGYPALDVEKYALAAQTTKELIDSASFYDYELLADFEDLWNKKGAYNNESIFTLFYKIPYTRHASHFYYCNLNYLDKTFEGYGGSSFSPDNKTRFSFNGNDFQTEIEFYNTYPKGYRKDITFYTRIYVAEIKKIFPEFEYPDSGYFNIEKIDCRGRAAYHKFFIDTLLFKTDESKRYEVTGCPRYYCIRFAQTLLTYAEAAARSGNLNEKAYECVNKVRRRANKLPLNEPSPFDLPPGLSPEAFADSVVQERAWELAGESGHRWFDMVRTQTVEKVFEKRDPTDGGPFIYSSNDKYFFPIPEHDIDLNPKLGE